MKIFFSVPSGYHIRELLLPLKQFLEQDPSITTITCITPGAGYSSHIFSGYGEKFEFIENPSTFEDHKKLLRKLSPDLVITTTAGLDTKDIPLLEAAKKCSIKTFTFIASWDNVWKMERLKKFSKPYVLADHMAVWNTMMKDHLLHIFPELNPKMISIVGVPRLDYFWHTSSIPSKEDLYAYLGIDDIHKKLVHIATTELYPLDYIVAEIASLAKKNELPFPIHMHASVHPGGNLDIHKKYAEKYGATVRYSFGRQHAALHPDFRYNPSLDDIYALVALFKYSSVLINHSSTVAIESFIADVPVINVKYGRSLDWWKWHRSMVYRDFKQHYDDLINDGATTIVTNRKQFKVALKDYLENPQKNHDNRVKTLAKMITITDGTASQRMFDLIKKQTI